MNKEELKHAMLISGELERFKKTELWDKAFDLYRQQTGDREVSTGCSACFKKVKEWLNK